MILTITLTGGEVSSQALGTLPDLPTCLEAGAAVEAATKTKLLTPKTHCFNVYEILKHCK